MPLNSSQKQLLKNLKTVAIELGERGKNLTSLIGELSACHILNMKWEPSDGYDCTDKENNKIEIKTRRDSKGKKVNKSGRLGRFIRKGKCGFDFGLYIELDSKFEVNGIYKLSGKKIMNFERNEKQGRGLHISTFLNNASPLHTDENT